MAEREESVRDIKNLCDIFNMEDRDVGIFKNTGFTKEDVNMISNDEDFEGVEVLEWSERYVKFDVEGHIVQIMFLIADMYEKGWVVLEDEVEVKKVTITTRDSNGWLQGVKDVNVVWACPNCGGKMGNVVTIQQTEDGQWFSVSTWQNDCGHTAKYKELILLK